MARIKIDLHDIYNRGRQIDAALEEAIREAVRNRVKTVEIIPGKGSGQLKKKVLRFLQKPNIRELYHRVEKDSRNFGRVFVHFRFLFAICASVAITGLAQPAMDKLPRLVRIDLGARGTRVQPGWTPWHLPPGTHWDHRGPFTLSVKPTAFDADGFTVTLGPENGIGNRAGPACTGSHAAVIAENIFACSDRPMVITLSGLPAGTYRIITWHNDSRGYLRPPVELLVHGSEPGSIPARILVKQTGTECSSEASRADFRVACNGRNDIRIQTRVPVEPHVYVSLNGIEVLADEACYRAAYPCPADGAADIEATPVLRWSLPFPVGVQRLLFGPGGGPLEVIEEAGGGSFACPPLVSGGMYQWRIDAGPDPDHLVTGQTWTFSVHAGRATDPRPFHGAARVSTQTQLAWEPAPGALTHKLWMGTHPDSMVCVADALEKPTFSPSLDIRQTWYWRVDVEHEGKSLTGDVWRFKTATRLVIDDMEPYDRINRIGDVWMDGRPEPDNETRIECTAPGRALRIHTQPPKDKHRPNRVWRKFTPPADWSLWRKAAISLRCRNASPSAGRTPRIAVGLHDADGNIKWANATPTEQENPIPFWTELEAELSAFHPLDLSRVERLSISVALPEQAAHGGGIVDIDDIALRIPQTRTDSVKPGTPTPPLCIGRIAGIPGAPPVYQTHAARARGAPEPLRADVCVVGGGSGGIGAALAAARAGANVILVEKQHLIGGTSTAAFVTNWEPGPGCSFAREIYERLAACPDGVVLDKPSYEETLTRASRGHVHFDVEPFHQIVATMLWETGHCRVLLNTMCTETTVNPDTREVLAIGTTHQDGTRYTISAKVFVDCTGGAYLCNAAGCDMMLGVDPKSRFDEPSAPEKPANRLNALELFYRIRPRETPRLQPLPPNAKPRRGGYAFALPNGDRMVNSCGGLAAGWELIENGYENMREILEKRVASHWHWLQKSKYPNYEFDRFAPMLAIRETYRVVTEYVLVEQDLLRGIDRQAHPDIVAVADHPMDTHGAGGGLGKVHAPYGIPYRCLVPKGWRNLLVACRGAGFSHIAASSCRLSRTIMALGHAAGLAAHQASREPARPVASVDVARIQSDLDMPPDKKAGNAR